MESLRIEWVLFALAVHVIKLVHYREKLSQQRWHTNLFSVTFIYKSKKRVMFSAFQTTRILNLNNDANLN